MTLDVIFIGITYFLFSIMVWMMLDIYFMVKVLDHLSTNKERNMTMLQQFLTGSVKSKTMQANLTAAGSLITFWNSEALSALPEIAKYIILGVLGINVVLRTVTGQSLMSKGVTKPNPEMIQATGDYILKNIEMPSPLSADNIMHMEDRIGELIYQKLLRHLKKPAGSGGKVSAAMAKSDASRDPDRTTIIS